LKKFFICCLVVSVFAQVAVYAESNPSDADVKGDAIVGSKTEPVIETEPKSAITTATTTTTADTSTIKELSSLLQSYSTYSADFISKTAEAKSFMLIGSSGSIKVKKPNLFLWKTAEPNNQIIVSNGEYNWMYDVDLQQATRQSSGDSAQLSPAKILSGDGSELADFFEVSKLLVDAQDKYKDSSFELLSKNKKSSFLKIILNFKSHILVDISVLNDLGQTTEFVFSNIKVNSKIDNDEFNFKAPPGVDVLDQ
jgi:outer membrane lipoprotein carrier protein